MRCSILMRALLLFALVCTAGNLRAQTPTPSPSLEQRVANLEAKAANAERSAEPPKTHATPNNSGPGYNGWLMTSTLLVLFMTLPGLALFYGGLVRQKNVLSVFAQCLGIAGLVTILWWAAGYSLVFSAGSPFIGSLRFAFLRGVDSQPNTDYSPWVSQNVFAMFQLMFAIITPALIMGSIAERMKFAAVLCFVALWMFLVYFPLAHMIWGIDGWMDGVSNRAHVFGLVRAGALSLARTASGFSQGYHGAPQHGALHGGNGNPLGRLVWI